MGQQTPEFVAYAIAQECALRGGKQPWHPLQAERQLRPLREFCKATAAGRVRGGICWEPAVVGDDCDQDQIPYGFTVGPMLDAYGGQEWVMDCCRDCPACAIRFPHAPPYAGCFGQIATAIGDPSPHARFEAWLSQRNDVHALRPIFLDTQPRWYGLWCDSPLSTAQQQAHLSIFSAMDSLHADSQCRHWCDTLRYALAAGLPVHVLLVPPGMVEGRTWTVNASCGRCGAGRDTSARSCSSCGTPGFFIPPRRRLAMGRRPYRDLRAEYSVVQLRELLSQQPD